MDIEKVAKIARINLDENEKKEFEKELKEVLKIFSELEEVNTTNVEPAFNVIRIINISRKDEVKPSLRIKDVLKNSKHAEKNYFKGPRII